MMGVCINAATLWIIFPMIGTKNGDQANATTRHERERRTTKNMMGPVNTCEWLSQRFYILTDDAGDEMR